MYTYLQTQVVHNSFLYVQKEKKTGACKLALEVLAKKENWFKEGVHQLHGL